MVTSSSVSNHERSARRPATRDVGSRPHAHSGEATIPDIMSMDVDPTPRRARLFEPRSRTRERIMSSLRLLLRDRPFEAVTVEELAPACGLARRTIYNQFNDLEEIYRACVEQMVPELARDLHLDVPLADDPQAALEQLAASAVRLFRDERYIDVCRQMLNGNDRAQWLTGICDRHIKLPLLMAIENGLLHRQRGVGSADARALATRLVGLLEAYSIWPRLNGEAPRSTDPGTGEEVARLVASCIAAGRSVARRRGATGVKAAA